MSSKPSVTDFEAIEKRIVKFFNLDTLFQYNSYVGAVAFSRSKVLSNDKMREFWIRSAYFQFEKINNPNEYTKTGNEIDVILSNPKLKPIHSELIQIYETLKVERLKHGGKKNYHLMIAAYFKDLAEVFHSLRNVTSENCLMCFVIGDSAPYGIYVPVDRWLGELAVSTGFKSFTFEKLRDRNVKWKNRKHTVPLHEGRLWIKS